MEQKMQQLMNKSLGSQFLSHYNKTGFAFQNHNLNEQQWTLPQNKIKFSIQVSGFILRMNTLSCFNNELTFLGSFSRLNGKSFVLPSAYKKTFLNTANKNAQNYIFSTSESRNQLILKCSLSFGLFVSTSQKINQCVVTIQKALPYFQIALQTIGLSSKFSKYSLKIKKLQLNLKKKTIDTLFQNSIQDYITEQSDIKSEDSTVIQVKQIVQNSQPSTEPSLVKKGGYFQVQKRRSIIFHEDGKQQKKLLACKTPLNFGAKQHLIISKIQRQMRLVKQIINKKYLVTYYLSTKQPEAIYMEYIPAVLKDYIYKKSLSFEQLLNFADQLISATSSIHQSGIVHRDLKPQNILIDGDNLKVIDYAQSSKTNQKFLEKNFLGCTIPYSPVECVLGKQQGFNKKQIDLWSIAIILYQMAFKSIPLTYTHLIGSQILQKWKEGNQFCIYPTYRKKKGLMNIQSIIGLCSICGIKIKQQDRLSLNTYKKLIECLKQFNRQFDNFI